MQKIHPRLSCWTAIAIAVALTTPLGLAQGSGPTLSEFMASNGSTLLDEDGESSDWIEVFYPGPGWIDLGGYHLSDDPSELTQWQFPSGSFLGPGAHMVIFASGKDRRWPGSELHTNFKLKASGEYLALVHPDGSTVLAEFGPTYPPQYSDASYGRIRESGGAVSTGGLIHEESYFVTPTPGEPNVGGGPLILDPAHDPARPSADEDLRVQVSVPVDLGPAGEVVVEWRTGYGTSRTMAMRDDGLLGDQVPGDGVFTALLSSFYYEEGEMVRYKIRATDSRPRTTALPPFLDPEGSPEYFGTVVLDPTTSSALPIWSWFVEDPAKANTERGTRAQVFYDGEFYDNVEVRRRGDSSADYPKKNYKFDFNSGHRLRVFPEEDRVDEANLNSTYSDKSFVRRIMAWELYRDIGVGHSVAFPLRIEQNGEFFSVATFVEEPDESYLKRQGLDPAGALYKMENPCSSWRVRVRKKTRLHEDNTDLKVLVDGVKLSDDDEHRLFMYDHVDIPACLNYLAATSLMHDNDHVSKNFYVFRETERDGEWRFLPWDKDLTFGRNFTLSGGVLNDTMWADDDPYSHPLFGDKDHRKVDGPWNRLIHSMHRVPDIRKMYLCRLRTVMETWLQSPVGGPKRYHLEERLRDLIVLMGPDVALDEARWGIPGWGAQYDFRTSIRRLITLYLQPRRAHLFTTHGSGDGIIPRTPSLMQDVRFGLVEGSPPSGNQDEEYLQILNPNPFSIDISGWTLAGGIAFTFEPGTVLIPNGTMYVSPHLPTFRARESSPKGGQGLFVVGAYEGHIAPGESIQLIDLGGHRHDERIY